MGERLSCTQDVAGSSPVGSTVRYAVSREKFDDECRGCRPAIVNPTTGEILKDDHPLMVAVMRVWEGMTTKERAAYHRACCLNSKAPEDLAAAQKLVGQLQMLIGAS